MAKEAELPAVTVLRQLRVQYEVLRFDAGIRDAAAVARETGIDARHVYKTLVVELEPPSGKRLPWLVMVASDAQLDLKLLASSLGARRLRMASHADAERVTGLKVGGISAIPLARKGFASLIDDRARDLEWLVVSAGARGADVRLAVDDLVRATGATFVKVSRLQPD